MTHSILSNPHRYDAMPYRRAGNSGLKLPALSLGFWQNFGIENHIELCKEIVLMAFDAGITHFDLANNYGPPPGNAESCFGTIFKEELSAHRDEIVISTKAGHDMWPGPYGTWGGRKHLLASLDQSLQRLKLDYVDIFYSHRPDPETNLEETMGALATAVHQGKALYVGLSKYNPDQTVRALAILRELKVPVILHQFRYSMLDRLPEEGLLSVLEQENIGGVAFSPLAQGLLTDRYLNGIPLDSRAKRFPEFLPESRITIDVLQGLNQLKSIAISRGQTLAEMALSWVLRDSRICSVVIGASNAGQLSMNLKAAQSGPFSEEELKQIDKILNSKNWK